MNRYLYGYGRDRDRCWRSLSGNMLVLGVVGSEFHNKLKAKRECG